MLRLHRHGRMADVPYGVWLRRFFRNSVILRHAGGGPVIQDTDGRYEVSDHDIPGIRHHSAGAGGGDLLYGILYGQQ